MKGYVLIIAIDPGKSGGIASLLFDRKNNKVASATAVKMPETLEQTNMYIRHLINGRPNDGHVIYIEKIQLRPDDLQNKTMFNMQKLVRSVERLIGTFKINGFKYVEVLPHIWQKKFIAKKIAEKKDRKNVLKQIAQERFRGLKVTLATADALCILEYARGEYIVKPEIVKHGM